MNQHLITYAEYLEKQASNTASASQYIDRGFSAEQSRICTEVTSLTHKAAVLRMAARTPEQIEADDLAAQKAKEYRSQADERRQAELDRITAEIAYPLFEKLKLEGFATASFFEAKYHRHLPVLETMFKESHNKEQAA